jgi:hypothetical protein
VRLDAADQIQPIVGELRLRRRQHGVDGAVAVPMTVGVNIASFLGPGRGDELAPTFRIAFVPGGEVTEDGFVDIGHQASPHIGSTAADEAVR